MATHSGILAWKMPWTGESGRATVHGVTELDMTELLNTAAHEVNTDFEITCGRRSRNQNWSSLTLSLLSPYLSPIITHANSYVEVVLE